MGRGRGFTCSVRQSNPVRQVTDVLARTGLEARRLEFGELRGC